MVCLQRSPVASCYTLQCGLIRQLSEQFCCLEDRATGKIALGLISSLIQCTANISDKDIWWREVHSSRLSSLEPEPCSLDCFRQHAHFDKQCMQCLYAGRQAGRQAHKQHTHTHTHPHRVCFGSNTNDKALQNHKYSFTLCSQQLSRVS